MAHYNVLHSYKSLFPSLNVDVKKFEKGKSCNLSYNLFSLFLPANLFSFSILIFGSYLFVLARRDILEVTDDDKG